MDSTTRWLHEKSGYRFNDPTLLSQALTHRSATGANNERLEFLGDAVLDFVVSDILYRRRPHADEGELSRLRASLVREATLADVALDLELGDQLILGAGERQSGGFRRSSILADAIEGIIGAVFIDGGFDAAKHLIATIFGDRLIELPDAASLKDPKTRLQEYLQAQGHALPVYDTERVSGKAHRQQFEVVCRQSQLGLESRGEGRSRRLAEQAAATEMLSALHQNKTRVD